VLQQALELGVLALPGTNLQRMDSLQVPQALAAQAPQPPKTAPQVRPPINASFLNL
jgi:hypothetical protein